MSNEKITKNISPLTAASPSPSSSHTKARPDGSSGTPQAPRGKVRHHYDRHPWVYFFLILGSFLCLFPFIWMILTSFKGTFEATQIPPSFLPRQWTMEGYRTVFQAMPFGQVYLNTIISAVVTTFSQLALCSMAAYAFARIDFPLKNFLFILIMAILMVPATIFIIPQYLTIQEMGLLNTLPAVFLPNLFSAFGTFLLRQFYLALPQELEDAALIDGCNHPKTFFRIMLPLTGSGLVAMGILAFRFAWNDLMWPSIVNSAADKMTLAAGLANLQGQYFTNYPALMAGSVMAIVPMLIVFILFQQQFIEGIALSGTKA